MKKIILISLLLINYLFALNCVQPDKIIEGSKSWNSPAIDGSFCQRPDMSIIHNKAKYYSSYQNFGSGRYYINDPDECYNLIDRGKPEWNSFSYVCVYNRYKNRWGEKQTDYAYISLKYQCSYPDDFDCNETNGCFGFPNITQEECLAMADEKFDVAWTQKNAYDKFCDYSYCQLIRKQNDDNNNSNDDGGDDDNPGDGDDPNPGDGDDPNPGGGDDDNPDDDDDNPGDGGGDNPGDDGGSDDNPNPDPDPDPNPGDGGDDNPGDGGGDNPGDDGGSDDNPNPDPDPDPNPGDDDDNPDDGGDDDNPGDGSDSFPGLTCTKDCSYLPNSHCEYEKLSNDQYFMVCVCDKGYHRDGYENCVKNSDSIDNPNPDPDPDPNPNPNPDPDPNPNPNPDPDPDPNPGDDDNPDDDGDNPDPNPNPDDDGDNGDGTEVIPEPEPDPEPDPDDEEFDSNIFSELNRLDKKLFDTISDFTNEFKRDYEMQSTSFENMKSLLNGDVPSFSSDDVRSCPMYMPKLCSDCQPIKIDMCNQLLPLRPVFYAITYISFSIGFGIFLFKILVSIV